MTEKLLVENGITLGYKLGRLEFLWGSSIPEAQEAFIPAVNEIINLLPKDIRLRTDSFKLFCENILEFYKSKDEISWVCISVGISFFRCGLFYTTNRTGDEIKRLIVSPIERLPEHIIHSTDDLLNFLLNFIASHKEGDLYKFIDAFYENYISNM